MLPLCRKIHNCVSFKLTSVDAFNLVDTGSLRLGNALSVVK